MRGLMVKDLCILKQRKTSILLFIVILFVIGLQAEASFTVTYGTLIFGILAQSTIAYDVDGNCMTYLLTLPVTVKDYVKEKFIFTGLAIFAGWGASLTIGCVLDRISNEPVMMSVMMDLIIPAFIVLLILVAELLIYIPIQLKFGPERSRIIIIGFGAVGFIVVMALAKLNLAIPAWVDSLSTMTILLAALLVSTLIIAMSYIWSVNILKKKEY